MTRNRPADLLRLRVSRRCAAVLVALILAPWALVSLMWWTPRADASRTPLLRRAKSAYIVPASKGPWGDLSILRIAIAPPEELVVAYLKQPPPRWVFSGYLPENLTTFLQATDLTDAQREALLRASHWDVAEAGCVVDPPDETVLSLSPSARAQIYGALSIDPKNSPQHEPFRFRTDLADEWLAENDVPDNAVRMVRRLSYQRGVTTIFSDLHLVLPLLKSDYEKIRLITALLRQSTLMVSVRITPETDVSALVAYWSMKEGRAKDIRPLIESLAKIPGGYDLDIAHLLPRFARKRLYAYSSASGGDTGENQFDCHWTTMNFWNDPPDDKFGDPAYVIKTIEAEYKPVVDRFQFGDVILFMKSKTQAIHSAVYLADDILYTKNGPTEKSPWILMKMQTLTSYYQTNTDLEVRGFRKVVAHP